MLGRALPSNDAEDDAPNQGYGNDLTKARNLYDTVNKALTTTVNGEFFEGTKSSNANRQSQLPEIFQLRDQIEGLVDSVAKKERLIAEQERIKNEGASKPAVSNATIQVMVQSAVEQQLEKKLRDEMIKRERVEGRLQKLEDKQPATIEGAKKIKKPTPASADDLKDLRRKVATQEAEFKKLEAKHEITIKELEENLHHQESEILDLKTRNATFARERTTLDSRVWSQGVKLSKMQEMETTVKDHGTRITEQFAKLNQLSRKCDELWESFGNYRAQADSVLADLHNFIDEETEHEDSSVDEDEGGTAGDSKADDSSDGESDCSSYDDYRYFISRRY